MTAAQAANILAGTANASATGVEDLRYSLSAVSAVAAGLGMNFEDTNVALGLFANRGLKGSDAGTSLKTMLQTLQPVTDEQIGLFQELGLMTEKGSNRFFDAAGNVKSLSDIAGTLRKSLSKLTNAERQHALRLMFGTDAVRAATILYKEGAEGVEEFRDEMSKVTALDVARKKMDNAAGAVEQFKGAIETLQIAGMMPLLPIVKDLANAAADFVERYTPQIVAGVQRMVDGARKYIKTHFIDNPEFQNLPDTQSKIVFVIEDLLEKFNGWWKSTGAGMMQKVMSTLTDFIINALEVAVPRLTEIGVRLGFGIAAGIAEGISKNPVVASVLGLSSGPRLGAGLVGDVMEDYYANKPKSTTPPANVMSELNSLRGAASGGTTATPSNPFGPKRLQTPLGKSGGIDRVPYNGATYRLHKDEAVLTKTEAKAWRSQGGGKSAPTIVIQNVNINSDMDFDSFVSRLERELAQ